MPKDVPCLPDRPLTQLSEWQAFHSAITGESKTTFYRRKQSGDFDHLISRVGLRDYGDTAKLIQEYIERGVA